MNEGRVTAQSQSEQIIFSLEIRVCLLYNPSEKGVLACRFPKNLPDVRAIIAKDTLSGKRKHCASRWKRPMEEEVRQRTCQSQAKAVRKTRTTHQFLMYKLQEVSLLSFTRCPVDRKRNLNVCLTCHVKQVTCSKILAKCTVLQNSSIFNVNAGQ